VASSSEAMRLLELLELQSQEGPCPDCYRSGEPVLNRNLAKVKALWPLFGPAALKAGFQSVHAVPMRLRGVTIGVLNLFRADEGTLREADVVAARALADVATIAILQQRAVLQAEFMVEQLNHALKSRVLIEQAKGILAERGGLGMDEAFSWLRNRARSNNLLLAAVAQSVIEGNVVLPTLGA
jgi:GAF domain-containing protein